MLLLHLVRLQARSALTVSRFKIQNHSLPFACTQAISAKILFDLLLVYGPAALGVRAVTEANLDASTSSISSEVDTSGEAVHTFIPQLFMRLRQSEREVCAVFTVMAGPAPETRCISLLPNRGMAL